MQPSIASVAHAAAAPRAAEPEPSLPAEPAPPLVVSPCTPATEMWAAAACATIDAAWPAVARSLNRMYTGEGLDLENALSEARMKALGAHADGKVTTLRNYFWGIAKNEARGLLRRKIREREAIAALGVLADSDFVAAMRAFSVRTQLDRAAKRALLRDAMASLAPRARLVVELRLQEMSYAEIAATMDSSVDHVGVTLNRAYHRLGEILRANLGCE